MITFSSARITIIQTAVTCLLALLAWLSLGRVESYSVMLGGLISVIPNAIFTRMVFSHQGARSVEKLVRNTYIGEAVKLVLMGAGFALVFTLVEPLSPITVFAGFLLTHLSGLVAATTIKHTG